MNQRTCDSGAYYALTSSMTLAFELGQSVLF